MAAERAIAVEVVYALPDEQVVVALDGRARHDGRQRPSSFQDFARSFRRSIRTRRQVGHPRPRRGAADACCSDGDRVEIYRPLIADPKQARRRRARRGAAALGERVYLQFAATACCARGDLLRIVGVREEGALAGLRIGLRDALPRLQALQIALRSPRRRVLRCARFGAFLLGFRVASCFSICRLRKSASRSASDFCCDGAPACAGALLMLVCSERVPGGTLGCRSRRPCRSRRGTC